MKLPNKLPIFALVLGATLANRTAATNPSVAAPGPTLRSLYGLKPASGLHAGNTALVLVDFQDEFVHGRLPLPEVRSAIERAQELGSWARRTGILVVNVQNVITRPDSPLFAPNTKGAEFVAELAPQPQDVVVVKATGGAFSKTNLDAELRSRNIDTLIVAGLMTHLAVQITVSDGALLGYHVIVAADATATRALPSTSGGNPIDARTLQRAALASMADRAADVQASRSIALLPILAR